MTPDVELRHLRYFIAVAEDLHFTRAAARLRVAQPALSQQIRQLETRLDTTLLARKPRVSLTPAGHAFLGAARRALAHVQQAAEAAGRVGAGSRAVLHIGLASSAALTALPRVIKRFLARHPDIDVRIREMHSADQLEALRRGALDLAVLREIVIDRSLVAHELVREPLALVLPSRHRLSGRRVVQLADCAEEPFVLFPRETAPTLHNQIFAMCREAGFSPRVENEGQEWHTIVALVAAGLGISVAPATVGALRLRGATVRRLSGGAGRAALFLCFAREGAPPTAQEFVRFALSQMRRVR